MQVEIIEKSFYALYNFANQIVPKNDKKNQKIL